MKKKWWILLSAVAALVLLTVALWVLLSGGMEDYGISTGLYLRLENGGNMIVMDGSPVMMSDRTQADLFADLHTGDEIRIRHGLIRETYPGGTDVYACKRISKGSFADIPVQLLEDICPMGYIPVDEQGVPRGIYTGNIASLSEGGFLLRLELLAEQTAEIFLTEETDIICQDGLAPEDLVRVACSKDASGRWMADSVTEQGSAEYQYGYGNMRLTLAADWEYEILPFEEGCQSFGISFWPRGQQGEIRVLYYPEGDFAVCGTGLELQTENWKSGLEAQLYIYDDDPCWSFICFPELPGTYVIEQEGISGWSREQRERAMEFLQSAELAQGYIRRSAVQALAVKECGGNASVWSTHYDTCNGQWSLGIYDDAVRYTLVYDAYGTLLDKQVNTDELQVPEKPVIYLYPQQELLVQVQLELDGSLTASYPKYENGWKLLAKPDGTLMDPKTEREYYCIFWEGITNGEYDFSEGFCVAGEDTAVFLEQALAQLGLTDREANEFIIYWAPRMEGNTWNLISFQQEAYTSSAQLRIVPQPDTLLRVFMAWMALEEPVDILPQLLAAPERRGFTAVEWGGAEVKP